MLSPVIIATTGKYDYENMSVRGNCSGVVKLWYLLTSSMDVRAIEATSMAAAAAS